MSRRKSPLVSALFKLTRAGVRQSARIGQAAARQGVKAGGRPVSVTPGGKGAWMSSR